MKKIPHPTPCVAQACPNVPALQLQQRHVGQPAVAQGAGQQQLDQFGSQFIFAHTI